MLESGFGSFVRDDKNNLVVGIRRGCLGCFDKPYLYKMSLCRLSYHLL